MVTIEEIALTSVIFLLRRLCLELFVPLVFLISRDVVAGSELSMHYTAERSMFPITFQLYYRVCVLVRIHGSHLHTIDTLNETFVVFHVGHHAILIIDGRINLSAQPYNLSFPPTPTGHIVS